MTARARDGAPEGEWLRAERQTGGRGRHGRRWVSPPGNLHASTLVRPLPGDPPAPSLALVAAVALDDALCAHAGAERVRIKWPNDLLLAGPGGGWAKAGGILLEAVPGAVVVGFGVNLAHAPEGIDRAATSLAAIGVDVPDAAAFLAELAASLALRLGCWRERGIAAIRAAWLARAHPIGTPLATTGVDGARIEGVFDGLDPSGALRLRLADGDTHVMHAGDVFLS